MPRKRSTVPWLDTRGGIYTAFWYNPVKRRTDRLSLGTADVDEAKVRFAAFLTEGRDVYDSVRAGGALTAGQALDDYVTEHVEYDVVDQERARGCVANLKQHFGTLAVRDIDVPCCRAYAEARRTARIGSRGRRKAIPPASDGTIRRELVVLTAAINHAVKWKRLQRNDVPTIELTKDSEPVGRWLSRDEFARLRAHAAERAAAAGYRASQTRDNTAKSATERLPGFIEIAYYTGSRRKAVERLTKFQVDMERGRIALAKPGERRTKKRRPVVPIDQDLRPTLVRLLAASDNEYVLGSPQPLGREFRACVKAAGLSADVTPHVLRHSRATHLLQDGVSLWAVANLLGDRPETVAKVYGHHSTEYMAEVLARRDGAALNSDAG